jgi:hypothetical protein
MGRQIMLDVIFLSYNEPNKEENWKKLLTIAPWAHRVDGIDGIPHAHVEAAKKARTNNFYVVDGDSEIIDFDFSYHPPRELQNSTHVWRCKNAVNSLIYGYGGLKLFPRKAVLAINPDTVVDFTTSVGDTFTVMKDCVSITRFNTGPFEAWKSGFRECAKLQSEIIRKNKADQNEKRIEIWCTEGKDKPFGEWAITGAIAGKEFGEKYKNSSEMLAKINDFSWLRDLFEEYKTKA